MKIIILISALLFSGAILFGQSALHPVGLDYDVTISLNENKSLLKRLYQLETKIKSRSAPKARQTKNDLQPKLEYLYHHELGFFCKFEDKLSHLSRFRIDLGVR